MGAIFTDLKRFYAQGSLLTRLILINVGVFVVLRLAAVVATLFQTTDLTSYYRYVELPARLPMLLQRPWTAVSYMFVHEELLHLLFNMLWLYWFGRIFLSFFTPRQLGGVYLSGGVAGAILYVVANLTIPYFVRTADTAWLTGASAAVMAIVFAAAFYRKEYEINLLLIGRIKLIYIALFILLIDLLSITSANGGGHVAHLGGALYGILYAAQFRQGRDLTAGINRLLDRLADLRKPRPRKARMKVTYRRPQSDMEYNARRRETSDRIDAILDKLKRSGYESLTSDEKKTLFDAGKN